MGREITVNHFRREDFLRFERAMVREMALLHEYFRTRRFSSEPIRIGLELELWLVDEQGQPQPRNAEFLDLVDNPDIVPELSQFNVEFNVEHQALTAAGLFRLEQGLGETWKEANRAARKLGLSLVAIGVLPTIREQDLSLETMSARSRYRALNEQVRRLRRGRPITLSIEGEETLDIRHDDVMLEAAATSLQMHLQVPADAAVRYFNAAVIASGPTAGLSSNSPVLFGKRLWSESRIPLFEKAVDIGGLYPRVDLGSGYAHEELEEFFLENRSCHPVLLPIDLNDPIELLPHLRLHNGTIWRWNRPLIGFNDIGVPHLRIEHRVMSAGPTLIDMLANVAFAAGLIHHLARSSTPPESQLPFELTLQNLNEAARHGLDAEQTWLDGRERTLRALILEELLPAADAGLQLLEISDTDRNRYLEVITHRVESGQTGSRWQLAWLDQHGNDFAALTCAYAKWQQTGLPVHEWTLEKP
ncbi:glutamate-cysteine ligase family protein [Planctomicrobium piriforme]|uniref:Gamma-glutamyl:cysteine ligase YbdK, ATP-grasp superfamily n=1 Tax=Planctomicrobium piriforme TaxID=1576369 RepID=A0A1I3GW43_9PLAN|nr:glutamate-cysteine ligase family protein [Planctomicrobium piriforme]SFI27785.1 Gamma-glutamyl:cysteine ligase YbdK, ATP-grasp superfamily [Planctomicrobium piriforme]